MRRLPWRSRQPVPIYRRHSLTRQALLARVGNRGLDRRHPRPHDPLQRRQISRHHPHRRSGRPALKPGCAEQHAAATATKRGNTCSSGLIKRYMRRDTARRSMKLATKWLSTGWALPWDQSISDVMMSRGSWGAPWVKTPDAGLLSP